MVGLAGPRARAMTRRGERREEAAKTSNERPAVLT